MPDVFARLAREGVSVWLDDLGRARLDASSIDRHVRQGRVSGLITDPAPTALLRCMYASRVGRAADRTPSWFPAPAVLRDMGAADLRLSCDLLAPVHRDSGGRDGYVSVALSPRITNRATDVVNAAVALRARVGRPNLMIRIPATDATLPAVSACLELGIPVQATGVFNPLRHEQVLSAACTGLERARDRRQRLSDVAFVVSFAPGAVDVAVDRCLDLAGGAEAAALRGVAGPALARLAQERQERLLDSPRLRRLTAAGALPPRMLWLTSVPGRSADTRYVEELVCPGTVTAVPEGLLNAVADHACVSGDRVHGRVGDARRRLGHLAWFGVELDGLTTALEQEAARGTRRGRTPATPIATVDASRTGTARDGVRHPAGFAA
ncbi:transaldolase family protein [Streptomyces sp. NPDC059688]|uniref:transaldolase family protein n=1 Tax=unclassified Streptomyces TaxID=2593676 RepID=UPI0033320A6B